MKITIDNYVLCRGLDESPYGFTTRNNRHLDLPAFFRAPYITPIDRQNRFNQFSFQITRLHDSLANAVAFVLTHPEEVPSTGLICFTMQDSSKGVARWMQGGVDQVNLQQQIGITTIWTYTMVGGELLVKSPNT